MSEENAEGLDSQAQAPSKGNSYVRCLSVIGLACDATPRELHILFSGCPGYRQCYLAFDSARNRVYGVVQFESDADAKIAKRLRANTTWDGEHPPIQIVLGRPDNLDQARVRVVARTHPDMVKKKAGYALRMVLEAPQPNQSPSANLARMKLEAAIIRRRIPDLNDAIAEGEKAGLPEEDMLAAKKLRHELTQRGLVTHAASAKRKAKTKLAQMQKGEIPIAEAIEAAEEADKLCSAAGFTAREGGGQFSPWDCWKVAMWTKITEAREKNDLNALKDIISESEAAGLIVRMPELRKPLQEVYTMLAKGGFVSPLGSKFLESPKSPRSPKSPKSPRSPSPRTPKTPRASKSPSSRSATPRSRNQTPKIYKAPRSEGGHTPRREQKSPTRSSARGVYRGL